MMTDTKRQKPLLKRLIKDRGGNFGIMSAILIPVVFATAGVALDLNRMVNLRSALQDSADAAAMAAATAMASDGVSDEKAIELAKEFMASQFSNVIKDQDSDADVENEQSANGVDPAQALKDTAISTAQKIKDEGASKTFEVTITGRYNVELNGLTRLLGWKTAPISVSSTAQSTTESKNALSMFLVLDRSGSMAWDTDEVNEAKPTKTISQHCGWDWNGWQWVPRYCASTVTNYVTKMEALKLAVANLVDVLKEADPENKLVRTAAISYHSSMQQPTKLEWGTKKTLEYVQALPASGGTDSSDAMARAYLDVSNASEYAAHKNMNGQTNPGRFIIFMTDGDNNQTIADTETLATCDEAKRNNVEIFTVAFMAPDRGRQLLETCATKSSNYYDAKNAAELVAAFKEIGQKASEASVRLTN